MFKRKKKDIPVFARGLHHQRICQFSARDRKTYKEHIIGRDGIINITEDEMLIVCQNSVVFRKPLEDLEFAELMSRNGFTIKDRAHPDEDVITAYYVK